MSNAGSEAEFKDLLLAELIRHVAEATPTHPSMRCWTFPRLQKLITSIRPEGCAYLSAERLIEWLIKIGLVHPVDVEPAGKEQPARFFVLEIAPTKSSQPDPIELLIAESPLGVVCYFSALQIHGLTTQNASSHHVAERAQRVKQSEAIRTTRALTPVESKRRYNPLGQSLFQYQGVIYYRNKRDFLLMPGVQSRQHGPRTLFQTTTLEQTLLDTLHKPQCCGGPSVVFEAWEVGLPKLRQDRLAVCLSKMNHLPTTRRLGALLEQMQYRSTGALQQLFATHELAIDTPEPLSFIAGMHYHNLNSKWLVWMP